MNELKNMFNLQQIKNPCLSIEVTKDEYDEFYKSSLKNKHTPLDDYDAREETLKLFELWLKQSNINNEKVEEFINKLRIKG